MAAYSYLNELKVAVINEDIKKLEKIIDKTPEFSSVEEAKEIRAFMDKAVKLLQKEKNKLSSEMQKIKKLQTFYQENGKQTFSFKA
jgi:propanediol dehydratase large subunit